MENARLVCVTGASGFIGSWIVCFLMQRGYHVRGTVQNLEDERETKHLRSLEGAKTQLDLFQIDLLDYGSLITAIGKSEGVFHLASPCTLQPPQDPQKELLDPAVQGTMNVLRASHAAGVKRVVITSSVSSMIPNRRLPPGVVVDENCWTDIEYCKEQGFWYPVSKVLAEKAAWKLAEELGLDVVVINPATVLGPMLQPTLNASSLLFLNLLKGDPDTQGDNWLGVVSVKDIAEAHILLYETAHAKGRHLCSEGIYQFSDLAEELAQMYPQYNVYRFNEETQPWLVRCADPSKKLKSLGFTFTPRDQVIRDAVSSLQDKGLLP
ncbi:hypothetical protein GOP47_0026035 [Adiantum capillus-veneris]|uniref:Flavanone 4-reductase n=1 Tax=Adiantum capillus-veneris TaxID=13818 RepID=A0A9D4U1K4_ADICA|nr:hypothetical protein GOP47_0025524 [Adiantum capillus-veneris]KAI5059716.1 hypothetical protein GOP47_0026035 [Adiantum capillus-veneris]